jgi:transposase
LIQLKPFQTGQQNERLFQVVRLDELVPEQHLLRRVEEAVDLSFIRELVRDTYDQSSDRGRPPWDPVIVFKMMLLGFLFNLSDHRLEHEVRMHAGYRWFLGLDFEDPVPDRTTLIKTRQRWGTDTFTAIFEQVLEQCAAAGLVKGETLVADGTQIRARAATKSLEQQVHEYLSSWPEANEDETEADDDDNQPPTSSTRQAGDPDFHGESFSNATHRSRTDPEARLYKKGPQQGAHLRYLGHYVIDRDSGVIVGAAASQAYGRAETEVTRTLLKVLREAPYLGRYPWVYMDRAYRKGSFLAELLELGYLPCVRIDPSEPQPLPTWQRRTRRVDWLKKRRAKVREARARNTVRSSVKRRSTRFEAARVRIEHTFAEAKKDCGLDRARGYGLETCHWQVLMTAITQNIKRLASSHTRQRGNIPGNIKDVASSTLRSVLDSVGRALSAFFKVPALTDRYVLV